MLSDLQREILLLTLDKGFCSVEDVLRLVWGWQRQAWGSRKAAIGESEYRKIHSTLSRCITRLWRRRLVKVWKCITEPGTGISLTPAGKTLAFTIMAEAAKEQIRG